MIISEVSLIPVASIFYDRDERQRSEINPNKVKELAASIADQGLIHTPIVNFETNKLASGEHRIEAFRYNAANNVPCPNPEYKDWTIIPVRMGTDISDADMEKIELLENVQRNEMSWQDIAKAIYRIHNLFKEEDPNWSAAKTSKYLTINGATVSFALSVAPEIIKGNEQIIQARGLRPAALIISRKHERAAANDMEMISTSVKANAPKPTPVIDIGSLGDLSQAPQETAEVEEPIELPTPAEERSAEIIHGNFLEWATDFSGTPFNFIHCDFPYGINHQDSALGYTTEWGQYEDSEDTFYELLEGLIEYRQRLILPSAHIMFWHSADQDRLDKTKAFIRKYAPEWDIHPYLMIWHKSDNKGIIPDAQRSGRNTYEVALQITVGDRKINRAVSMSYAGPSRKSMHASEKPIPMLHHFFRMFVDEYSRMLDPTCGSGNSIRAAYDLKAEKALGFELLEQNAQAAINELARHKHLADLSGQVENLEI